MLRSVNPGDVADTFLLDVREHEEWSAGHAPHAVHVPMNDVPDQLALLPRDQAVAVVCRVGVRSAHVADWLRAQGYDAHNVEGGMLAWEAAGLPIEGWIV